MGVLSTLTKKTVVAACRRSFRDGQAPGRAVEAPHELIHHAVVAVARRRGRREDAPEAEPALPVADQRRGVLRQDLAPESHCKFFQTTAWDSVETLVCNELKPHVTITQSAGKCESEVKASDPSLRNFFYDRSDLIDTQPASEETDRPEVATL